MTIATKKRLTKAENRVLVAKDVLKHLKSKKFKANTNEYISYKKSPKELDLRKDSQVCDFLNGQKECKVCAMGALFAAQVMRFNKLAINDIAILYGNSNNIGYTTIDTGITASKFTDYLSKLFTPIQFRLIEAAFEKTTNYFNEAFDDGKFEFNELPISMQNLANRAVKFGKKYPKKMDRMVAIMKNIIKNNGTFKP